LIRPDRKTIKHKKHFVFGQLFSNLGNVPTLTLSKNIELILISDELVLLVSMRGSADRAETLQIHGVDGLQ
jgi:hypothetical protein